MMKRIYAPSLDGRRYFYSQDADGLPVARIPTEIKGKTLHCIIAPTNVLNPADWLTEPRPEGYVGQTWPPTRVGQLLRPSAREFCIVCKDDNRACKCNYERWLNELADFVTAKVALRQVPGMGYGGFARGRILRRL
jgi:hypothetical protein